MRKLLEEAINILRIEMTAIGNELCYGKVAGPSSFRLACGVTRLGVAFSRITCIRDYDDVIYRTLEGARKRNMF